MTSNNIEYVFFGTPEFAAIILQKLIDSKMPPKALVSNPDRPVGRKKILSYPPTKRVVKEKGLDQVIEIFQPDKIDDDFIDKLKKVRADFFVVAAYARILPREVVNLPLKGTIGVHPSLLPKYRGPTPIQTAILNGDEETGVTLFLLDEKVDHGPIIAKRSFPVGGRNYGELMSDLADLAGEMLIEILPKFAKGAISLEPQDETQAVYTKKFISAQGFVDSLVLRSAKLGGKEAISLMRMIRALNPEPGVFTIDERGRRVKLLDAELSDGRLVLKKIQIEGGKPKDIG